MSHDLSKTSKLLTAIEILHTYVHAGCNFSAEELAKDILAEIHTRNLP